MSSLLYQIYTSTCLLSLGLYHLISTLRTFLKSPQSFHSKPFHHLPLSHPHLRLLPLYLTIFTLISTVLHHILSSLTPDPLLPTHSLSSLLSSSVSSLFLLLSFSLLLHHTSTTFSLLPNDLFFALSAAAFLLHSSSSSSRASLQSSTLESRSDSLSSHISLSSSFLSLGLALFPRLFVLDVSLSASVILQGLWALQTGMTLYVEAFIPEGCHRLLDVVSGVEGSTKCDLEESTLRAVAILDLAFVVYVVVVVVVVFVVFAVVAKTVGVSRRLGGAYEALPTNAAAGGDANHVQLKTLSGTQA